MISLTPRPLRFVNAFGAVFFDFESRVQVLLDARNAKGTLAEALVREVESLIPLAEPPSGILGELIDDIGDLRQGPGDTVALLARNQAVIGSRSEVLGDVRDKFLQVIERRIGEGGDAYELALLLRRLKSDRPMLRAVEAGKSA